MPNRILRDWTDSEPVNSVSIHAERFFTRLIMKVDDFGRLSGNVKLLRPLLYPLLLDQIREADLQRLIAECVKAGLVRFYEVNGKQYIQIENFKQRSRADHSKYPEPTNDSQVTVNCQSSGGPLRTYSETYSETYVRKRAQFEQFWKAYPKKKSKGQAEKAWGKIVLTDGLFERIAAAVESAKASRDWQKEGGKYIPHPATWLNAKGWEDEHEIKTDGGLPLDEFPEEE